MPWFCGQCSRWNRRIFRCCPTCGRPPKGRLCKACKAAVPKKASHCTQCGSARLSDAGSGTLPLSIPVRLLATVLLLLLLWGLFRLLSPLLVAALLWICRLLFRLTVLGLVFWLLTGLLPDGLRQGVRKGVGRLLALLGRYLVHLVK